MTNVQRRQRQKRARVPEQLLEHLSSLSMTSERPGVCVLALRELRVVGCREEEELSKFPRPGELSFTAEIKKLTPFSRVWVKRNTGLLPWNDSASPGAKYTRWRPVSQRCSDSPLCSACAAVFWRNVKVCLGDIRTRTWLAEVAGKSQKGPFFISRVLVRHLHKNSEGKNKITGLHKKPQRNLIRAPKKVPQLLAALLRKKKTNFRTSVKFQ